MTARGLPVIVMLLTSLWMNGRECRAETKKVLRAGAYAIDVTPLKLPVIVNGSFTERLADKVTDPLHARCLVLDDGSIQIALAVVDNCVIPRSLMDNAKALAQKKTGIPSSRMLISATHAHSCPSVCAILGSGQNDEYIEYLTRRIAEGIALAQKNLAPARVGWAVGSDPKNVFCRRYLMKPGTAKTNPFTDKKNDQAQMNPGYQNPNAVRRTGVADTDVSILSVQSPDGRPIALLGNYSTHYAGAPALSADYFAVFAGRIAELIGATGGNPPFVGIMSNGTSGDANCNDFENPPRKYTYITVGQDVAQAAYEAYKTIQHFDWVPLVLKEERLTLGVRMPTKDEVAKAKAYLAGKIDQAGWKPANGEEVYARETIILDQMPPTRELKLQAIRIGSLGIDTIPCEVFGVTGLTIKKDSPLKPTFTIELANGYDGYLPPLDQHALGGYTTWRARSSCLEVDAEPKIRAAVLNLLNEVAQERANEQPVKSR